MSSEVPSPPPLEPFAENVWTTARPQKFWGVECGTRMTVVKLANERLFVHGPVSLDARTRKEIEKLGTVQAVVCSSLYHHLYAGEWMQAYPDASFHACPGLEKKRSDLAWTDVLSNDAPRLWSDELEQVYFSARFEHEVVFFHRATRTLVCLDALLNLSTHPSRATRLVARLMANTAPGKGYLEHVAVQRRAAGRREVAKILEWDIDGIVLAHGGLVRSDGRRVFRDAYSWLVRGG